MMVRMVTIIHLPEASNPKVGPPTLSQPRTAPTYAIVSFDPFRLGRGGSQKSYSSRVPYNKNIGLWGVMWGYFYHFLNVAFLGGLKGDSL